MARLNSTSRRIDLLLQAVEPDRTDYEFLSDHIGRCSADSDRLAEAEILVDGCFDFRARHIPFKPVHVDAGLPGGGERTRTISLAATAEQFLVEFEVFF